jgi:hypothetical protein
VNANDSNPPVPPRRSEGRFVRWQSLTNRQFGYALNLFLTFATGALAFSLNETRNLRSHPCSCAECLLVESCVVFLFSLAAGIWCVLNRLRDFRLTAKIARMREKRGDEIIDPYTSRHLVRLRRKTKRLGKCTWTLLCWQIGMFSLGVLLVVVAFGISL